LPFDLQANMLVIMTTNITTDKILRDMSWLLCF
jgi:hypothetical protein